MGFLRLPSDSGKRYDVTLVNSTIVFFYVIAQFILTGILLVFNDSFIYSYLAGFPTFTLAHYLIIIPFILLLPVYFIFIYGRREGILKSMFHTFLNIAFSFIGAVLLTTLCYFVPEFIYLTLALFVMATISYITHCLYVIDTNKKTKTNKENEKTSI